LPARIHIFKNKALDTSLFPTPIITQWGTCSDVVAYYSENFENFENFYSVVNEFDTNDASCIEILQIIFTD
jgi:hypothetical protein